MTPVKLIHYTLHLPSMEFRITTILDADQLTDKAFLRASKKEKSGKNHMEKTKNTVVAKLNTVSKVLETTMKRYEKEFPSFENLPLFYQEVIHIMLDTDRLKKSIGALNWARRRTKRILMESARETSRSKSPDEMEKIRKKAYARTVSVLKQIDKDLIFLQEARTKINSLPDIRTDIPTVVVAGYPNVGKSLLVSKISSGKPKVAVYPFTTREVGIGHFMVEGIKCQLIDTPGLLDRRDDERNDIEKQAVSAIKTLADMILFVFDPSESCGYPISDQEDLAVEIKNMFTEIEILEVENKLDILESDTDRLKISAMTDENVPRLWDVLSESMKSIYKEKQLELHEEEGYHQG